MNPAVDRDEPGKLASGVLAVGVHVAFFALLVFGATWQRQPPDVVMVDLWNNLPPVPAVKPPPPPRLEPEIKPPPPLPIVKPEPKIVAPKPVPEPKPAPKPDIAIEKEKQEKARRDREEKAELKKREEAQAEQKKREEREKAETAKREAIDKQKQIEQQKLAALEKERAAKETERARLEKEQNQRLQQIQAEAQQMQAAAQQMQAAAQKQEFDAFRTKVQDKIKRFVVKAPCAALSDPEIVLEMKFFPDGNMIGEPVVRKSSGSPACDDAVRRAAILAQPLPLPPPGHPMLSQFMNLNLRFKPND